MRQALVGFIVILGLTTSACKESGSQPSQPVEPDLTRSLAGVYTLTKLTNKDATSTVAVTGTGSATIIAVDKSWIDMQITTTISLDSTSINSSSVRSNYKVTQNGNDYFLAQGSPTSGLINGNKLTKDISVLGNSKNPKVTYLTGEFTK